MKPAPAPLLLLLHTLLGDAKHLLVATVAKDLVEADYETLVAELQPRWSHMSVVPPPQPPTVVSA